VKVALIRELSKENIEKVRRCGVEVVQGVDYDADIVLVKSRIDNFHRYKNLKWIHTSFTGVNNILTNEVKTSKVIVTNSKGNYGTQVPEHAIAMILAFNRRLKEAFIAQQNKVWKEFDATELYGKTVGIIGLGVIGTGVAKIFKTFGCRVIGTSRNIKKNRYVDKIVPIRSLEILLSESDYVVLCVPLTRETRHLIGKKELEYMKKSSILINISRGEVVDEKALIDALKKGKIKGSGLDVFETEPLHKKSPLWLMKNVIITAHYAGVTQHQESRAVDLFCKNLKLFLKGKKLINVVDKEKGY